MRCKQHIKESKLWKCCTLLESSSLYSSRLEVVQLIILVPKYSFYQDVNQWKIYRMSI